MTTSPSTVHLVPHTHWDREWYEPFQRFRLRLVHLLDEVLDRAECDPDFRFTLDGQMACVDDYLEVRPQHRERVARLVEEGRLAVGPWQILLDEFLCSGETIVRNLELGWTRAQALGGAMAVGYLPDMFGHCAQMPQLLVRAGLRHACIYRGVPAEVDFHAFRWRSPDGSSLRAEYLMAGYGNGVDLFALPDQLATAVAAFHECQGAWFGSDPALAMFGTDHSAPLPTLMTLVRGLDTAQAPVRLAVMTLVDHLVARDGDASGLRTVTGELRSHARANILPGVISVRVPLKQAMARAERMVAGYAEPLAALWSDADLQRFLDMAWWRIVDASGHDSVTGCGVDETAVQVAARLAEAEQLGQAVRDQVLAGLASTVPSDAYLVVNPSPRPRTALVELDAPAPREDGEVGLDLPDGTRLPVQELGRHDVMLSDEIVDAGALPLVLRRVHGRELFGQQVQRVDVGDGELTFHVVQMPSTPDFDPAALRARVADAARRRPGTWRVRIRAEPRRRVLAAVSVPPLGWTAVRPSQQTLPGKRAAEGVTVGERFLGNGLVDVAVDTLGCLTVRGADGTILSGVGRLVDGGDRGDTYNYAPPAADVLVSTPREVQVRAVETGPLRGVVEVVRTYDWPLSLDDADRDERSAETAPVPVRTLVELRAGEPFVRLTVSVTNPAADHRLRLHVPLPRPADRSHAEGQFAVTARGLESEGGGGEHPLPTFPASGFVAAGDAVVLLESPTEYELVGGGAELALTLLRCVGRLSVNVHPLRDEPAGPQLATPQAQLVGVEVSTRLAVLPRSGGWAAAGALPAMEGFRHDLVARPGAAAPGSVLPAPAAGLALDGEGAALTSVRRRGEELEARVVALSDAPVTARLTGSFAAARRVGLLGQDEGGAVAAAEGVLELALGPWEVATVRLTGWPSRDLGA